MAKEFYQAFACPDCGEEVDLQSSNFCQSCGVNLLQFSKIDKATFYEEYPDIECCPKCKQRGIVPVPSRKDEYLNSDEMTSRWYECHYLFLMCRFCKYQGHKLINRYYREQQRSTYHGT